MSKIALEKTWLLCFERYCYFCYHATLVDVKRKRTRKGEMKLAMSSICNTQKYWIVADGKVFLLCNNRFLSLFIQNDHRLSICKFSITNIIQNPINFNCIEHIDHNDRRIWIKTKNINDRKKRDTATNMSYHMDSIWLP